MKRDTGEPKVEVEDGEMIKKLPKAKDAQGL